MRIEYDPEVISYQELLDVFWAAHSPFYEPLSRQYMSIIFYHDEEQRQLAEASKAVTQAESGRTVITEIIPVPDFYPAEDYHQKYYLKMRTQLFKELNAIYPDPKDLTASTAAARINGYLGGYGEPEIIEANLDKLGLSETAQRLLLNMSS